MENFEKSASSFLDQQDCTNKTNEHVHCPGPINASKTTQDMMNGLIAQNLKYSHKTPRLPALKPIDIMEQVINYFVCKLVEY